MPFGGMDAANWALARWLSDRGKFELHLIGHRADTILEKAPRVKFHKVSKPFGSNLMGFPLAALRGSRIARELAHRGGRTLMNGGNCPVFDACWVHYLHAAHEPLTSGSPGARARASLSHALYLRCERLWLPKSKVLFANSQRTKKDILRHYPVEPDRIQVVYYGNEGARFHPLPESERLEIRRELGIHSPSSSKVAVFVGALGDRRKGFDLLYEAWLSLAQQGPSWDASLLVVGAGRDLDHWRARAVREGMASQIRFLGFRRDVEKIVGASDLMVHAARYEAYGLAVQEALCCGLPVIVSEEAGVSERIPKSLHGLRLKPDFTAQDIASRLLTWRNDFDHFASTAQIAGQNLARRSWDDMAEEMTRRWLENSPS